MKIFWASLFTAVLLFGPATGVTSAHAATVVALGASNTYGKGVSRQQAYPAQLEALLRARGLQVQVINAGINGDTTGGMLRRLGQAVPKGTQVVILQPGGNDQRKGVANEREKNIATITSRLTAQGIRVILMENNALRGLPHQEDGQHLTPAGYRSLAEKFVSEVVSALGK